MQSNKPSSIILSPETQFDLGLKYSLFFSVCVCVCVCERERDRERCFEDGLRVCFVRAYVCVYVLF